MLTLILRDVVEIRISMFLCVRSSFDATREHFERKFVALSSSSRLRGGKLCEKRRETKMVVSQNCELSNTFYVKKKGEGNIIRITARA